MATGTAVRYPITRPTLPDSSGFAEELRRVLASGQVTANEQVARLEAEICSWTGVEHAIAVSSGTSALLLMLRALNLPKGSEVIVPSFTFVATAHALLWNGLKPVFCDSEPDSFTMDAASAEALVNERTSAIYPVCVFGVPGDLDSYQRIADRYGLRLIFDSAQGLGSEYKDGLLGGFGDAEAFSLSPTKVITAVEGGLITTNDSNIAEQVRCTRNYGKMPNGEDIYWLGLSARMSEINALIARWSLAHVEDYITSRQAIAGLYRARLADLPGISFQHVPSECRSCWNYVVMLIDPDDAPLTRDELYDELAVRGIQTKRYFHPALHNQTFYRGEDSCRFSELPVAERISDTSLALPMCSHMRLDEVDEICDQIIDCMS